MEKEAKIFVAGHRGLVGSAIFRALEAQGYANVVVRTRQELDLSDARAVGRFFAQEKPEYVFLAAARVGGIVANRDAKAQMFFDNMTIEMNVIQSAHAHGVKKLLFLGSSCIYPKFASQPITEDALMTGHLEPTNDAYAVAKIAGIQMCRAYAEQYGFKSVCVMPCNLYGIGDNFDLTTSHVLPGLLRKVLEARERGASEVMMWGSGTPKREFLYVDDLADACVFLMNSTLESAEVINAGTGEDVAIRELLELICTVVGFGGAITADTSKPDGTPRKVLDVSRIHALGWRHTTSLREGIERTLAWYLKERQAGSVRTSQDVPAGAVFIPPTRVVFSEEDCTVISSGVEDILQSGRLTLGEHTKKFEEDFAALVGVPHAVAVASGTAALEIVLRALRLEGGSVVVPANTFFATAAAVVHAGAVPVFADCDDDLFLDIDSVQRVLRPDTRAVVAVHIGGFISPRMHRLKELCDERGIYLIEDAAHAHGSALDGKSAGSFGIAGTFSLYPTKIITSAEGGMIVTSRQDIADLARGLRDQGKTSFTANVHTEMGYNWRMSEPHALIGHTHLSHLKEFIEARRAVARVYDEGLREVPGLRVRAQEAGMFSNYYKYIVFTELDAAKRTELKARLKQEHAIGLAGEVYELPLHRQPVFEPYARGVVLPRAERLCASHICLPMSSAQTAEEARRVSEALRACLQTAPLTSVSAPQQQFISNQSSQKRMKIAVVGGSGFIGSHIVDKLMEQNHEIIVFDIMRPRRDDVWHITLDILNASSCNTLLTGNFDAVYMLAAMANVNDVFNNPLEACDVNIRATVNILEAARKNKIPRVILSSTVWLYEMADGSAAMATEDTALKPDRVNHVYTATKLAAEQYCRAYKKLYGQDYTILRYGIPYGPRGRVGTVIYNFVQKALSGEPLTIQGDGSASRNFIYVEDLAEGNVAALQPQAASQTYNLDGLRQVSVKEVAEIVQELIPGTRVEYTEARPGDFAGFSASYEKARRDLGWQPHTDIRDGIARYIEWARSSFKK